MKDAAVTAASVLCCAWRAQLSDVAKAAMSKCHLLLGGGFKCLAGVNAAAGRPDMMTHTHTVLHACLH